MLKPSNSHSVRRPYQSKLAPLYAVNLLLVFVSVFTAFVNSAYISQYYSESAIGIIYTVGSCLGLLTFLFVSRVLQKIGNYKLMFFLLLLTMITLGLMATLHSAVMAVILFSLFFVTMPLLFYSTDVFLEAELDNKESSTGSKRGLLLTLIGLVAAVAPLIMSIAIPDSGDFSYVYGIAALFIVPVIAIMSVNLKTFSDPKYSELDIFKAIRSFMKDRNIRDVYVASLTLNMYFAFTVIYLPLYLVNHIGLSWDEFGIIVSIGILAYLIFEYPVGVIADKYTGEKEFMAAGLLILILSTAAVTFVTTTNLVVWVVLLFVTRIGASIVEVTTESYFFKKTKSSDAQIISFFRTTRPISYVVIALIGSLSLTYLPFNMLFVVAAMTMVPALFFIANLVDTK